MVKLICELNKKCNDFVLKYYIYEEIDSNLLDNVFYSLLVILQDNNHYEFAQARNFTSSRIVAELMLKKTCAGKVTPVGLYYVIEDYIAEF